jgi:hypothetical protein
MQHATRGYYLKEVYRWNSALSVCYLDSRRNICIITGGVEMNLGYNMDLEACKILWQHKKVFFIFAALPILLDLIGVALSNQEFMDVSNTTIAQACMVLKWLIALPLFAIAWFRHLLNPSYTLDVKSYFQINSQLIPYSLFSLLIFSLCLGWDSLCIYLDLKHGGFLFLMALVAQYYYIIFLLITTFGIIFYFFLPSILILPCTVANKTMTVMKIVKESFSYRSDLLWRMVSFLFLLLFVPNMLLEIDKTKFSVPLIILKSFTTYMIIAIILNLITLYYIRHLKR